MPGFAPFPRDFIPDPDSLLEVAGGTLRISTVGAVNNYVMIYNSALGKLQWAAQTGAGGTGAPLTSGYVLAVDDASLVNARVLIGDPGASNTVITDIPGSKQIRVSVASATATQRGVAAFPAVDFNVFSGVVALVSTVVRTDLAQVLTAKTMNATLNFFLNIGSNPSAEFQDQPLGSLLTFGLTNDALWLNPPIPIQSGYVLTIQANGTLGWSPAAGSGAPIGAQYLLRSATGAGSLSAYRVLTAGPGLRAVDGGALGALTVNPTGIIFPTVLTGSGGAVPTSVTYVASTVPANFVITGFTYPINRDITIEFEIEAGPHKHTPAMTMQWTDSVGVQNQSVTLSAVLIDGIGGSPDIYSRRFRGSKLIQLNATQAITITSDCGATASIAFTAAAAPPNVTAANFNGTYPIFEGAPQTAVKGGDATTWNVTIDAAAAEIVLEAFELGTLTTYNNGGAGFTAGTYALSVITSGTAVNGLRATRWHANATGGQSGAVFTSTAQVNVDQNPPTIAAPVVTYPVSVYGTQLALKGVETATVTSTVTGQSRIEYNNLIGEVSASAPTTYVVSKIWTRIGGTYNITTNNGQIKAVKQANGSSTTTNFLIKIADALPTLNVRLQTGGLLTRFRSAASGPQTYPIRILSTQDLVAAVLIRGTGDNGPALPALSGTASGDTTWDATLTVEEDDTKGTYTWLRTGFAYFGLNLAHKEQPVLADPTYTVGGFLPRQFSRLGGSLQREFVIGTTVLDVTKLVGDRVGVGPLTFMAGAAGIALSINPGNQPAKFSISQGTGLYNATGTHFYWIDDAQNNLALAETFQLEEVA